MFLAGNLVVAFLSGFVIILPVISDHNAMASKPVVVLSAGYAIFAFLMSLSREIIKDCEDLKGDARFNASTIPVVLGLRLSRIIAASLGLSVAILLGYIQFIQSQWEYLFPFLYIVVFIQAPPLFLSGRLIFTKTASGDAFSSRLSKGIMIAGLLSILVLFLSSS